MKLDKDNIKKIQDVANLSGGYLTVNLYDKNRGNLPAWETLKKQLDNIDFGVFLTKCNVDNKEEYTKKDNKIKAISNMKIINLEYGFVSTKLYDQLKYSPSSEYIGKHFGWVNLAKEASVKLTNSQYASVAEMIKELRDNIKQLGYIPTSKEFDGLAIKPSAKSFATQGISWSEAMRKAGYRPYGKAVHIKDKVCKSDNCFRQFTPANDLELYCEPCYKELRGNLIKALDKISPTKLKEIGTKLIYGGNSQVILMDIYRSL